MRPLSLEVHGFTCFRDLQPALDFSPHTLFAITGPTGAGKSSVLDAMTFALYGKVPRMGRGSVKDLISHGRDRLSVTMRFTVADRTCIVTRMIRRSGGPGICQLDEQIGAATRAIASGVRDVDEAVERLVGLDYDAFTQAVVLPQGEFARFLKGAPAQRRQILQDLLRLGVYGRMQKLAGERSRDARKDVEAAESQLAMHADATPEAIRQAETDLAGSLERHATLVQTRDTVRAARVQMETRVALARELCVRRQELEKVRGADAEQRTRLEAIARARRARDVSAELAQHSRDRATCNARAQSHATAQRRLAAARDAAGRARARHDEAQRAFADASSLRSRAETLRALEGRLQHLDALAAECHALERTHALSRDEVTARQTDLRKKSDVLAHASGEVARLDRVLVAATFDPLELQACEQGRDIARELRSAREQGPALDDLVRRAKSELREAVKTAQAELAAANEAHAAFARAEAGRDESVRRLTDAQDAHRAMTLRRHLHQGDTCPVCAQPVETVPPVELTPELASLLDAQNEAAEACRTLAARVAKQQERHVRADAAAEGARHRLATAETNRGALRDRITASIATLATDLAKYLPASRSAMPEHWLLERIEDLQALRMERESRERRRQIAEAARVDAGHVRALAEHALAAADREAKAVADRHASRVESHDALQAEIRRTTDAADPRAELARLTKQLNDTESALDAARLETTRHDTELAAAIEGETHASRAVDEALHALDTITARITTALSAFGFMSVEDAASALMADADLGALASEADAHDRRRATLEAQVGELSERVGSDAATDAELSACVSAERSADDAVSANLRRTAQLEVQLESMRARALSAATTQAQLSVARQTHEVYSRLSTDLKADAFQAWLLRESFERLVTGASTRLMELSGRYTLQWVDDEFVVVDHDNAQERRAADTLSGGETFLASLALALELSEQVQRAAGAVRLDSLFIDEGFGTLDAAAQDVVASAIESLQVSGRMVGIITHVRELTDRMPASVVIDKRADGSRWSVRAAGV